MKITQRTVTIRELVRNFHDDGENGVYAMNNNLLCRPPYQREFVYSEKQQEAVIDSVMNGFPISIMYWADDGEELDNDPMAPRYSIIDGQQRSITICLFYLNRFSWEGRYYNNFYDDEKMRFLNYPLTVYVCSSEKAGERLAWFERINIAGEPLTEQELLNATFSGSWVTGIKTYFSKTNCAAYKLASDYMKGDPIRQEYLEEVLKWVADRDGTTLKDYMAVHQHDEHPEELWNYFKKVIRWVKALFTVYRSEMKGIHWGILYNRYHSNFNPSRNNPDDLEKRISSLMEDDDITKKSGIYEYLMSSEERCLSIRKFSRKDIREAYERQKGSCPICGKHFDIKDMQADHIIPWSKGGPTTAENCQMLCAKCNREKSNK